MIDVACALIVREGKILLAQNRAASDHPLQWEFPGGKLDDGESERACILREIREELALNICILSEMESLVFDYGKKQIRLIPFLCKAETGSFMLNDHENALWLAPGEIENYDLSAADRALFLMDSNQKILKKYLGKQVNKS